MSSLLLGRNLGILLAAFLSVFALSVAYRSQKNPAVQDLISSHSLSPGWFAHNLFHLLFPRKAPVRCVLSVCLFAVFAVVSFYALSYLGLSDVMIYLLFLPLALLILLVFHIFFTLLLVLLQRLLNCGSPKRTLLFSFAFLEVLLLWACLYQNTHIADHPAAFWLACLNLFFCYILAFLGLLGLLRESLEKETDLTLGNVWKLALLEIFLFLCVLSLLSYLAWLYFPLAYQTPDGGFSLFTAFYHIVITFGTVGYGDVVPLCAFTRAVSILTVFTSISCITIMLSAVMSLARSAKRKRRE